MNTFQATNYHLLDRESLLNEVTSKDCKIRFLEEQLAWFKKQIFGKRSERIVADLHVDQLVFEGFETLATQEVEKKSLIQKVRKKPEREGKDKISLPEDLPVKTLLLDIPENEKTCPETGVSLVQIGVEI